MQKAFWTLGVFLLSLASVVRGNQEAISLSGEWQFSLGPGISDSNALPKGLSFSDTIRLPGTTDENGKGKENNGRDAMHLTRVFPYRGPAWYQREVSIPDSWKNQRVTLFLERTKCTRVWIDGKPLGEQESLCCPHVYDANGLLSPGRHCITVLVNNAHNPPIGDPHQITDQTQTNWNGVIGRIELRATPQIWIDDVKITPDAAARKIRVRTVICNTTGRIVQSALTLQAIGDGSDTMSNPPQLKLPAEIGLERSAIEADYQLGSSARLWDEFLPSLYRLKVRIETETSADQRDFTFGLREFKAKGTQLTINGRTTFLRGKHDACVFPLTGYPPMDVEGWIRVMKIAQSYGINHYRFHSWCPPDAAFTAADQLGIYIQAELPNWRPLDKQTPDDCKQSQFCMAEGDRILATYGNHPSFVMLTLGNELHGNREVHHALVQHFQSLDARQLYAEGTNAFFTKPSLAPGDDFWVTDRVSNLRDDVRSVRGSFCMADAPLGHVQIGPANTMCDFGSALRGVTIPVIGHEIGQYTVFPDFKEITKYTGVLRAGNLEIFREKLQAKGMLDQAEAFQKASGVLAVLCYREDIEAALRTPGFGGFQILDLQDFPGQGTALVGILDSFLDSKGLITPKAWREFCSEVVPLVLMPKYTWTSAETLSAAVKVANYGPMILQNVNLPWNVKDPQGGVVASGALTSQQIPQGTLSKLGEIEIPLSSIVSPQMLTLEVAIDGTNYVNHYRFWVYPPMSDMSPSANLTIAKQLDAHAEGALADGRNVLLMPEAGRLANTVGGAFATDFWCWPMFHNEPGTMGILCDPKHPSLQEFPTESHCDWQWFPIVTAARPIILDATPADYRPTVQVIDNIDRNDKLGLVFEAKVGPGRLLVCACDLTKLQDQPAARQLLKSLIDYAASSRFQPNRELSLDCLRRVLAVSEGEK